MRNYSSIYYALVCFILFASILPKAYAEEQSILIPMNFNFYLAEFDFAKAKSSGVTTTESTDSETSMKLGKSFIGMPYKSITLYLYPFADANRNFSLGYMVTDKLELGLDVARKKFNNKTSDAKGNESTLGGWVAWYDSIGQVGVETVVTYDTSWSNSETTDAATGIVSSLSSRETFLKPCVQFVFPIAKNASYFNGVGYSVVKNESAAGRRTTSTVNLILAGLRKPDEA